MPDDPTGLGLFQGLPGGPGPYVPADREVSIVVSARYPYLLSTSLCLAHQPGAGDILTAGIVDA